MGFKRKMILSLNLAMISASLLTGCQLSSGSLQVSSPAPEDLSNSVSLTLPSPSKLKNAATPTGSSIPKLELLTLKIDQDLPSTYKENLQVSEVDFQLTESESASITLTFGDKNPVSQWVYALVAPFPTVTDEIESSTLTGFWQNTAIAPFKRLILDQSTCRAIESLWGKPNGTIEVLPAESLLNTAWQSVDTWAIVPFEGIQPRWKVIAIDGQSPLQKDFIAENYALIVPISLIINDSVQSVALAQKIEPYLAQSNRDPDKLATIILTGVTALVRATAWEMETKGITRPADVIGATLREADVLHISNEVPFAEDCEISEPPFTGSLIFCSKDSYAELLKVIGTDVVELTGDHFEDWGAEGMEYTLALYEVLGWPYYGGGMNIEEAKKPLKLEVNSTKIAFLGCNAKGTDYGNATKTKPGNFRCDMDYMAEEVTKLKEEGYLPIVTFQHNEYYDWTGHYTLMNDFHRVQEAGAVIVSGSQAHQPHAIEITDNAVLHYGLGNLFLTNMQLILILI